jgi:hypothetical protein
LGLLRHLIQHRPGFRVVLAGAHSLNDYPDWLSYLVNLQSWRLSYLSSEETRELIEKYAGEAGIAYEDSAIARIIALSRGHPLWAHTLCEKSLDVKKRQALPQRDTVTGEDIEQAIPAVFEHSKSAFNIFYQHERSAEEQALLRHLAQSPDGMPVENGHPALRRLLDSEAIEQAAPGYYRVQVELLRRWVKEHG